MNDDQIIRFLLDGDDKQRKLALSAIYGLSFRSISNVVRRMGGTKEDIEDIYQEALLVLYKNLLTNKFRKDSSLKTYLYSISKNIWTKSFNKKVKKSNLAFDNSGLKTEVQSEINSDLFSELFNHISDSCKKILVQFYFEKRSMEEIMDSFQLGSIQAAKNKKYRCLQSLIKKTKELNLNYQTFLR